MYISLQTLRQIYFFRGGGGGDNGVATGIAHNSMIMDGCIIATIPRGTEKSPMIGDRVTTTVYGAVGLGILLASITAISITIGGGVVGEQSMD